MNSLPCIYSTAPADAVASLVAERFAVGAIRSCRLLRRGLNDTYEIEAAERRCLLRVSRCGRRRGTDLEGEAGFLAFLRQRNVPVAAAIAARDGAYAVPVAFAEGTRFAMLFERAPGRPPLATPADARAHGVTLAAIHEAGTAYRPGSERFSLDLDHLLDQPLAFLASVLEDRPADRTYLEDLAGRLRGLIATRMPLLSRGQCHGDCHGINARIDNEGVATFFDFDDGGEGWIAYDLAVFLWSGRSFNPDRRPLWQPFLEGYRTRRAIAPADLDAVTAFVPIRHLWLLGEFAAGADGWGREWLGDFFDRQIEFLRGWEDEQLADPLRLKGE